MGFGDSLIGTGEARGAAARGRRIAFGDGKKILWDHHSQHIYANNPNIAPPGHERAADLKWVAHYKGNRLYNRQVSGRWEWNFNFRVTPGELFFSEMERDQGQRNGRGFVVIEPHVPRWKSVAANKDWGVHKYQEVAFALKKLGLNCVQFIYGNEPVLNGVTPIKTRSFRDAVALLRNAWLYVGPEGGLHHGAAAMGTPGVVMFGGFIPPAVTGYAIHTNLTGGAEACGSINKCEHCRLAMAAISVEEVVEAAKVRLVGRIPHE